MFNCPKCQTSVPFSKAFTLQKNSIIQCRQCRALLKPDSLVTGRIQLWGALLTGALTVAGFRLAGIFGAAIAALAGYGIIAFLIHRYTCFYLAE